VEEATLRLEDAQSGIRHLQPGCQPLRDQERYGLGLELGRRLSAHAVVPGVALVGADVSTEQVAQLVSEGHRLFGVTQRPIDVGPPTDRDLLRRWARGYGSEAEEAFVVTRRTLPARLQPWLPNSTLTPCWCTPSATVARVAGA